MPTDVVQAPNWTEVAAGIGSIVAAVVAAIAAFRKFGGGNGEKKPPLQASSDRTAQTIDAAWKLIDQLQEENSRLNARIAGLETQRDANEDKIAKLKRQWAGRESSP